MEKAAQRLFMKALGAVAGNIRRYVNCSKSDERTFGG